MTDTYYSRTYNNGYFTYIIEDGEGWLDVYKEKKLERNLLSNVLSFLSTHKSTFKPFRGSKITSSKSINLVIEFAISKNNKW